MTNQNVEEKPSETALFAALRRTIAHKDYPNEKFGSDDLAVNFLPGHFRFFLRFQKIRENTKEKLNGFLPGLNEYMIARTVYFDGLFADALREEIPQIVLLGAGYDTRAYRFSKRNLGTRIFELDMAPTQNRKKECLQRARIDTPDEVKLVPIDFNNEAIKDVLEKAGYDKRKKTRFIWEGVSYYLDAESVDETLNFVSHCSHPESSIAFDYTVSLTDDNKDGYFGAEAFAQTMKEQHGDEALTFSIDEVQVEPFLADRALRLIEHLDNEEIEKRLLTDDDGVMIGRITGHFRFVLASPRNS